MDKKIKQEIIRLTAKLISFKTTASRPKELAACAAFIKKYFQGLSVKVLLFNKDQVPSLIVLPKGVRRPKVLLNGHFDVVDGTPQQFKMELTRGKIIGRGALDMKTQVAALMVLFREQIKINPKISLGLMLVGDEELGGVNGTKYLLDKGFQCDFAIAGEPSDLRIANEAKGILTLRLMATGKSSHSARPWQGDNAIVKLNRGLSRIVAKFPVPSKAKNADTTTYTVTKITGGEALNQIPDYAEAFLNVRYLPSEKPAVITQGIRKIIPKGVGVELVSVEPAAFCAVNNPNLQALARVIENVTGAKAQIVRKAAGSDIRHFTKKRISGVVFGPSGGGSAHSSYEWIDLKSLEKFYLILRKFVLR